MRNSLKERYHFSIIYLVMKLLVNPTACVASKIRVSGKYWFGGDWKGNDRDLMRGSVLVFASKD